MIAVDSGKERLIVTTQRAYTLRLNGADKNDNSWRERLWNTHEAVNKGAKTFGDWLLTMRGGLSHTLADSGIHGKGNKPERKPTQQEINSRRIVIALSWLSVESEHGAPKDYYVPHDLDTTNGERTNWKTIEVLREILKCRGVSNEEIENWLAVCKDSITATIREDAVWVNRSNAFDNAMKVVGESLSREELWDFLEPFFASKQSYLELNTAADVQQEQSDEDAEESKELSPDKAKDLSLKAGQWLSSRFGTGKGADFKKFAEVYDALASQCKSIKPAISGTEVCKCLASAVSQFAPRSNDLNGLLELISGPGYKSATQNTLRRINALQSISEEDIQRLQGNCEADSAKSKQKTGSKGGRPYADAILREVEAACGMTYLGTGDGPSHHWQYAVILDHAARRASMAHSWIKRAEEQRSKFEVERNKLKNVPVDACEWLDAFCAQRGFDSGAKNAYRIRRGAVDGWKQVVAAWGDSLAAQENAGNELLSEAEALRIQAARELQDSVEKFGDIQLFEALARTEAKCVWTTNGKTDAQWLLDYVAGTDAITKKRRFKVPAYRHPDALLHPIFCEFGNSRWSIDYAIHRAPAGLTKAQQLLERKRTEIAKVDLALAGATGTPKQPLIEEKLRKLRVAFKQQDTEVAWLESHRAMTMGLWDGRRIQDTQLLWHSKRFGSDTGQPEATDPLPVSRADRLGRAATAIKEDSPVIPFGLFDLKDWNGRLQAPRRHLEAIAAIANRTNLTAEQKKQLVSKRISSISWLVTFSAKLQSQGPWLEYATQHDLFEKRNGEVVSSSAQTRDAWRGIAFPFWHHSNPKGKGSAVRHVLSCLPGLRILSVDLGHRYAAACAVWETLNSEQIQEVCENTGTEAPGPLALYLHLEKVSAGKTSKTIYRRIGADRLTDGSLHPASWARLDRQFLIKLQGEDRNARLATNEEIAAVDQIESALGFMRQAQRTGSDLLVDELMSDALHTLRLGLRRHSDRARIAFNLTATKRLLSGGREEPLDKDGRIGLLQETLLTWHELNVADRWKDDVAEEMWHQHIKPLLGDQVSIEVPNQEDYVTSARRREQRKLLIQKLKPIAMHLENNDSLCRQLQSLWNAQWQAEDNAWRPRLRWIRRWLSPRGIKRDKDSHKTIRHVGGLSLTRIASFKVLYQIQKAFHMRPCSEDLKRNIPDRGDNRLEGFGQSVLDAMERMRENRVKQLASRIAEAALGIGSEADIRNKNGNQNKRAVEQSEDFRFAPCHAVVIENLTHYRPDETRTRRENRQLMDWSSSKVKKYLSEACQLYALHLREVPAAFTSRQDSRTGSPGRRCSDVKISEFSSLPYWRKQVRAAQENQKKGNNGNARERYLLWLDKKISSGQSKETDSFLVPSDGGELFVSAYGTRETQASGKGKKPAALQADLNAAANIGLRALLDPDWGGAWWRILCDPTTFMPDKRKYAGSTTIDTSKALRVMAKVKLDVLMSADKAKQSTQNKGKKSNADGNRLMYLWRDPSSQPVHPGVLDGSEWQFYAEYKNCIENRVIQKLLKSYDRTSQQDNQFVPRDEDIPF